MGNGFRLGGNLEVDEINEELTLNLRSHNFELDSIDLNDHVQICEDQTQVDIIKSIKEKNN